jgi:hypothetical protein
MADVGLRSESSMTGIMAITAKIPMKIGDSDQSHIYLVSFAVSSFPSVLLFVSFFALALFVFPWLSFIYLDSLISVAYIRFNRESHGDERERMCKLSATSNQHMTQSKLSTGQSGSEDALESSASTGRGVFRA